MSEPVKGGDAKPARSYDSSRRKEQARQTQRAVLRAAHDLFVERGYGRTTIADIARAAGVSPELIYATFRNKVTLLHRVWDITIGGDDEEVLFHERPEVKAMRAEPDLATRMRMFARMQAGTARRTSPFLRALQGAAASEPAAADMVAEVNRQRLEGMTVMAREGEATGQLAVSMQRCRDVAWALIDGNLWHQLVTERGWTDDDYAEWLGQVLVATLVRPTRRPSRRRP
jgi:AcrR family transcriptional regulator